MNFDWSMVKNMPKNRESTPFPVPIRAEKPRFDIPENSYPVKLDQPLPLLEFISWCVPDDRSPGLGAIGRLYDSLEAGEENTPAAPAAR
ncbi:hypothetical protein GOB57_09915 [Sinorhizobium meliloti]|nr:hypothetical protein [Sinorhizobium meliloti]